MTGAPLKLTPKVIKKFCEAISLGMRTSMAARYAGVSPTSIKRWLKLGRAGDDSHDGIYVDLCESLEAAKAKGSARLFAQVQRQAKTDWRAAAFLLKPFASDETLIGPHPADVPREQWLRNEMERLTLDIERMRALDSWQAATNSRTQLFRTRDKLDELLDAKQEQAVMPATLDELFDMLERLPRNTWEHPRAQRLLLKAV